MWHKSDAADTQLRTDIIHRGKLHALCIGIDPTTADHYLGTKPTATHTGVLSPWVIRYLELHPHLTRLVTEERTPLPHWYEVSDYSNDYHCTSYVGDSPGQVFYHLRADPFLVLPGLLADPDTVPYPLRRDTSSELHPRPVTEEDVKFAAEDAWYDFTFFMGRAVSKDLLAQVVGRDADGTLNDHGAMWRKGRRGLTLSDEMWQKLRDWRLEVAREEDAQKYGY